MTKIVNPYSFRIGVIRGWRSQWITREKTKGKQFISNLRADVLLREHLYKTLRDKFIGEIEMDRGEKSWKIKIHTARPGQILGKGGDGVADLKKKIERFLKIHKLEIPADLKIDIIEITHPETNARVVGMMIAEGLEKRLPFRRVMKGIVEKVSQNKDVMGVKVYIGGRLGGADMARSEILKKGNIPLQTLRADIDFSREKAYMTYGVLGIKVWIYKGNIFNKKTNN
jgi:small subunit ribosomal protein S3